MNSTGVPEGVETESILFVTPLPPRRGKDRVAGTRVQRLRATGAAPRRGAGAGQLARPHRQEARSPGNRSQESIVAVDDEGDSVLHDALSGTGAERRPKPGIARDLNSSLRKVGSVAFGRSSNHPRRGLRARAESTVAQARIHASEALTGYRRTDSTEDECYGSHLLGKLEGASSACVVAGRSSTMTEAISATVGDSNRDRTGSSTPNVSVTRATI